MFNYFLRSYYIVIVIEFCYSLLYFVLDFVIFFKKRRMVRELVDGF